MPTIKESQQIPEGYHEVEAPAPIIAPVMDFGTPHSTSPGNPSPNRGSLPESLTPEFYDPKLHPDRPHFERVFPHSTVAAQNLGAQALTTNVRTVTTNGASGSAPASVVALADDPGADGNGGPGSIYLYPVTIALGTGAVTKSQTSYLSFIAGALGISSTNFSLSTSGVLRTISTLGFAFDAAFTNGFILSGAATGPRTWTFQDSSDTVVGRATTDIFTNKTYDTAGTGNVFKVGGAVYPSGAPSAGQAVVATGAATSAWTLVIPAITVKAGTGGGVDYTTASASYVDVDGTNLAYTVTVPVGQKATVIADGEYYQSTAVSTVGLAITDGTAVLVEKVPSGLVIGAQVPFTLVLVFTGDGASHTFKLRYKTGNVADAANIVNASATRLPTLTVKVESAN